MANTKFDRLNISFGIALLASLTINVFQGRYILALQADQENLSSRGPVRVGTRAPVLDVMDSNGDRKELRYEETGQATFLYVFRPECPWCERNSPAINSLARQTSKKYRIVGLSLTREGLSDFVKSHNITFPVYSEPATSVTAGLQLGATPETIVISPNGRVIESWSGAYLGKTRSEVEKFFVIALPPSWAGGKG